MNPLTQIKNTQKATNLEIDLGLTGDKSWHARYKHSAYVFAGGLPFDLTEGDVLAVFTDGLTDARSFESERFGRERLVGAMGEALDAEPEASAGSLVERVFWSIRQFSGLQQQVDDETLVIARIV
jgi:RNA-binding motif X-linked protein 2